MVNPCSSPCFSPSCLRPLYSTCAEVFTKIKSATSKAFSNLKAAFAYLQSKSVLWMWKVYSLATCSGNRLNWSTPNIFKRNKEIVLAAIAKNAWAFQYADDSLKKDKDFVLAAIAQNAWAFQYADDSLKKDTDFVLAVVAKNALAFQYADDSLKKDTDFVLAVVAKNALAFYSKDKDFVLAVLAKNALAFYFADDFLKNDKNFVLRVVAQNPFALPYADNALQKDTDVILAVTQYWKNNK